MIAFHPQKMLVANLDQPVYRGYHGPFTRLVRRCDDSNTPRLDRRLMGAVSVLRGRLTLELSPCARSAPSSNPLSCREDLVASCDRTRCQRRGRYHRALVLHGAAPARRPGWRLAPRRAQRLRQDLAGASPCRATASSVPRSPGLELSTALRQPRRLGGSRSDAWEATLLFHGQALHAGPRPGEEARAFFARAPWRSPRRTKAANARDPQL